MGWYLHAGLVLGYSEREVWRMTPRKIYALYQRHIRYIDDCAQNFAVRIVNALGVAIGGAHTARGSIDDAIPQDDF